MFATRKHDENAVYERQTVAAGKNNGVKGLAPKTPANRAPRTPFKVPLNNENAAFGPGKTGGKGLFGADSKANKIENSAFATPAGPRTRPPLGAKTTNAKATAFQTPAPPTQEKFSAKPSSPRLRRGKIKIHAPEASAAANSEDDLQDIEYMPPREVPLPDQPDDWPVDRTYPQFESGNLTNGWWSEFAPKGRGKGEEEFSDFEEGLRVIEKRERNVEFRKLKPKSAKKDPLTTKAPSTLRAKSAAAALSNKTSAASNLAAPLNAAKARLPSSMASEKPTVTSANPRHTAAKAASNTTLGYCKGRTVSAAARRPLQRIHQQSGKPEAAKPKALIASEVSLDQLLGFDTLTVDDEREDERFISAAPSSLLDEEEEMRDFQLDVPEL